MVDVINLKTCKDWGRPGDVKIDRTTKWGNPFLMGKDGNRDDVCNKYAIYIRKQIESGNLNIKELQHAKRLGCWCKPLRCHGDELKKILDGMTKTLDYFGSGKMYNIEYMKHISRNDVKKGIYKIDGVTPVIRKLFVFGDNDQRMGFGGQAKEMRGEPNAVGIRVKKAPSMDENSFYNDDEYILNTQKITQDLNHLAAIAKNKIIVFPEDGVGTGMAMLNQKAPQTFNYLTTMLDQVFGIKNGDLTHHNAMMSALAKQPTGKFKPVEYHIGELIRFGSNDRKKLMGKIIEIYYKGSPNERYVVKLDESDDIKLSTPQNKNFNTVIVDKTNVIEKVIQLRKRNIIKSKITRPKITKKPIKKCVCKPKPKSKVVKRRK